MQELPADSTQTASVAFASAGLFTLLNIGLGAAPHARWVQVAGLGAHTLLLPLTARLAAPGWARSLGYAWFAVDGGASVAALCGKTPESVMPVRLGGHLLAAGWLVGASQALPRPARWLGWAAAGCLGGHSLVAPFTKGKPPVLLYASGPLLVGWLAVVGWLRHKAAASPPRSAS